MAEVFNIYCDESCHLENDKQKVMVLGAVWCPLLKTRAIARHIRDIKMSHGLPASFELKWTKVSKGQKSLYLDIMQYFFDEDNLHFRALVVSDKSKLNHIAHKQDHESWYYKMYFDLLKVIFRPRARYRIYLDIKDTCSAKKIARLHQVLCNNVYDFDREVIEKVQTVRSHEVEQIQIADLLLGSVCYANRKLSGSQAKIKLIEKMKELSGYCLTKTTLLQESKVNIFCWKAREGAE